MNMRQTDRACQERLLDDTPLSGRHGVVRVVQPAEKLGPIRMPDPRPGWGLPRVFGTVLQYGRRRRYRMYYHVQRLQPAGRGRFEIRAAESADGLTWTACPSAESSRRSRALAFAGLQPGETLVIPSVRYQPANGLWEMFGWIYYGSKMNRNVKAVSRDGLRWHVINRDHPCFYHIADRDIPFRHVFPDRVVNRSRERRALDVRFQCLRGNDSSFTYADPMTGQYRAYGVWLIRGSDGNLLRVLMSRHSLDQAGLQWSSPQMLLLPDSVDPAGHQLYYMAVTEDRDLALGLAGIYNVHSQTIEVRLAVSRDRRHWQWVSRDPILPLGPEDGSAGGMLFTAHRLIDAGDDWRLYYSAHNYRHDVDVEQVLPGALRSQICVARLAKNRLASLRADRIGEIWTQPFYLGRGPIILDCRCQRGGSVRAALCDPFGKPFRGCALTDCRLLTGRAEILLGWKGAPAGRAISEAVSLKVRLEKAEIFGWRWRA